MDAKYDCPVNGQVHVRVQGFDENGNRVPIEQSIIVEKTSGEGYVVNIDDDALGFTIASDVEGMTVFKYEADGDTSEKIEYLQGEIFLATGPIKKASSTILIGEIQNK